MVVAVPRPDIPMAAEGATRGRRRGALAIDCAKADTAQGPRTTTAPAVPAHKWLVAVSVILGPILEVLDSSIVNVSLPHMQGSFSAGVDEVAWVVTSYLVANGIMIPMTGWISARFGRKRYFIVSLFSSSALQRYAARRAISAR